MSEEPHQVDLLTTEFYDRFSEDVPAGAEAMAKRIIKSKPLLNTVGYKILYEGCASLLREHRRALRSHLISGMAFGVGAPSGKEAVTALARATLRSFLDFPLTTGRLLRDATREDVYADADFYLKQSRSMKATGVWLQLIAQHVPKGKTVGKVLTNERLSELREEARHGIE